MKVSILDPAGLFKDYEIAHLQPLNLFLLFVLMHVLHCPCSKIETKTDTIIALVQTYKKLTCI